MRTTSIIGMAAALLAMGLSTVSIAGARGGGAPVFRAGGHGRSPTAPAGNSHAWGRTRMAHGVPPVSGVWHVRGGATYFTGFGHTNTASYGHTNTGFAAAGMRRFARRMGDGERLTDARRDFTRGRPFTRFAYTPRDRFRYGWGSVGTGGYGGEAGASPGDVAGGGNAGYQGNGYAEAPLAATYGEPPVGQGSYAEAEEARSLGFAQSAGGYGGGPQIIVINNGGNAGPRPVPRCSCTRSAAISPVVYRFGVGSYY